MKDHERLVLWLDYFDSNLSRSQGRRVPFSMAVKAPRLQELLEAAKRVGYLPEAVDASHPKRPSKPSGYVSVERRSPKERAIKELAMSLRVVRGGG